MNPCYEPGCAWGTLTSCSVNTKHILHGRGIAPNSQMKVQVGIYQCRRKKKRVFKAGF